MNKIKTQEQIKSRKVYFFTCKQCAKEGRQSYKRGRAQDHICGSCRRLAPDPNQKSLF